jgi:diguanylate cyclase (GGDEF)-like protein
MFRPTLFFVDDERNILSSVARLFHGEPVEIRTFGDPNEALEAFVAAPPAAIVSDYRMPGMDGIELLERCREAAPSAMRILLTGYVDLEAAVGAINRGSVYRFLRKPWETSELKATVLGAVAEAIASRATNALPAYFSSLISVESREGAISALRAFLGESSGLGIADVGLEEASAPAEGGLDFSCSLGGDGGSITIQIDAAEARVFREAGLEERLSSIVQTAVGGCRIAAESAQARARIVALSERDPLTGLYNRRAMAEKVQIEGTRQDRYGPAFSVILMDIDSFKTINDRYGHATGDAVIAGIGKVILRCCRAIDVPSRLGGDEFLVALPSTPAENAIILAKRIQEQTRMLGEELGLEDDLTLSIGVAVSPKPSGPFEELIAVADQSMYKVKRSGKNGIGS